jgi:hypothetical protein
VFEREDNTDRFFVEAVGWDEVALNLGFSWLIEYAREHDDTVLGLVVASKRQIDALAPLLGTAATKRLLSTRREVEVDGLTLRAVLESTTLPFDFREGPILVVWTRDDRLEKIDGLGAPAICAITWSEGSIERWKAAWGPVNLRTGDAAPASTISNPVVRAALEGLTTSVNLSTGLSHPSDRSHAVAVFKLLVSGGERYDPDEVRAWATSNGWQADDASELAEIAGKIKEGRRLRSDWRLDREVLGRWRERAAEITAEGADES